MAASTKTRAHHVNTHCNTAEYTISINNCIAHETLNIVTIIDDVVVAVVVRN